MVESSRSSIGREEAATDDRPFNAEFRESSIALADTVQQEIQKTKTDWAEWPADADERRAVPQAAKIGQMEHARSRPFPNKFESTLLEGEVLVSSLWPWTFGAVWIPVTVATTLILAEESWIEMALTATEAPGSS